jgi:X-X-X-Leu-X-X-Gly heptad repeat protein
VGGSNCTIAINFDPVQAGALTGSAVETDNSLNLAGSTQAIHLIATGVAASTTTTVTSSLNPSVYQQSITFTAIIAPTTGTAVPTGTVQFSMDGTAVDGLVTLNNGVATYATGTLAVGTHTVSAVYTPDSTSFTGSNRSTSQMVNKIGTTIAVASSVNPSALSCDRSPSRRQLRRPREQQCRRTSSGGITSDNSLALQVGGGVDLAFTRHIGVRVLQADWVRTQLPNDATDVQNTLRLGAGIIFRLPC